VEHRVNLDYKAQLATLVELDLPVVLVKLDQRVTPEAQDFKVQLVRAVLLALLVIQASRVLKDRLAKPEQPASLEVQAGQVIPEHLEFRV